MERTPLDAPLTSRVNGPTWRRRWVNWLRTPTAQICAWALCAAVFLAWATYLGGPNAGDSAETIYATWAVAHGAWSCLYPPLSPHVTFGLDAQPFTLAGPLYPLVAGAASWMVRIGHAVAFPPPAQLGAHCANGYSLMQRWGLRARALEPTLRVGYLSWAVLAAGLANLIRVVRARASVLEPVAVLVVTLSPAVVHSLTNYFHPEDLLAIGLSLLSTAQLLKGRAATAGVALALAYTAQPLALLAGVVLAVLALRTRQWRFALGAGATIALIAAAVGLATQGRGLRPTLLGSNRIALATHSHVHAAGGTVLAAAHVSGLVLFLLARVAPVLASAALSWWVLGRDARALTDAPIIVSLVGLAFVSRLVFEENIFSYYFAAVVVLVVAADAVRARWRASSGTWLALCALAYPFLPLSYFTSTRHWPVSPYLFAPGVFILVALGAFALGWPRRRRWYLLGAALWTLVTDFPSLWGRAPDTRVAPTWLVQIVLVLGALVVLGEPLWREGRLTRRSIDEEASGAPRR